MLLLLLAYITLSVGQCTSNSDCPALTPYCYTVSGSCVSCLNDFNCRNTTFCNGVCNNFECQIPIGESVTVCKWNEICYNTFGKCYSTCSSDSDCALIPNVLHYPNTGVCDKSSGRCYDCLQTSDCKPYRNESCNAECTYNTKTMEYLCSNGNVCDNGRVCTTKSSTSFQCSDSNIIIISYISIFIMISFIL